MPIFKVGTDDFKELRDDGGYFVDKSLLIKEVIDGSKALLLPRPRRFGKTLNLSMLRYFFEQSPDDRCLSLPGSRHRVDAGGDGASGEISGHLPELERYQRQELGGMLGRVTEKYPLAFSPACLSAGLVAVSINSVDFEADAGE